MAIYQNFESIYSYALICAIILSTRGDAIGVASLSLYLVATGLPVALPFLGSAFLSLLPFGLLFLLTPLMFDDTMFTFVEVVEEFVDSFQNNRESNCNLFYTEHTYSPLLRARMPSITSCSV